MSDLAGRIQKSSMPSCTGRVTIPMYVHVTSDLNIMLSVAISCKVFFLCHYIAIHHIGLSQSAYRKDLVEIVSTYQYNDSVEDTFEREPFSVHIQSKNEREGQNKRN